MCPETDRSRFPWTRPDSHRLQLAAALPLLCRFQDIVFLPRTASQFRKVR